MKKCASFVLLFTCFLFLFTALLGRSYVAGTNDFFSGIKSKLSLAGNTFENFINQNSLRQENEALKKEITDLKAQKAETETLKEENKMLTSALDIKESKIPNTKISASVVGINTYGGFYLTIDRGKNHGISKGDVCVFGSALVGKVREIFDNFSTVTPITADSCVVGVENSHLDAGTVTGKMSLLTKNLCRVEFFGNVSSGVGDVLVTSGLSDTYPQGLLVGEIYSVDDEILLKTQVDFFKIRTLCVIPTNQEVSREGNKN